MANVQGRETQCGVRKAGYRRTQMPRAGPGGSKLQTDSIDATVTQIHGVVAILLLVDITIGSGVSRATLPIVMVSRAVRVAVVVRAIPETRPVVSGDRTDCCKLLMEHGVRVRVVV